MIDAHSERAASIHCIQLVEGGGERERLLKRRSAPFSCQPVMAASLASPPPPQSSHAGECRTFQRSVRPPARASVRLHVWHEKALQGRGERREDGGAQISRGKRGRETHNIIPYAMEVRKIARISATPERSMAADAHLIHWPRWRKH